MSVRTVHLILASLDHPGPSTLVLNSRLHDNAQLLCSIDRPVRVPQQLTSKVDDVSLALLKDLLGLRRLSDQTDCTDTVDAAVLLNSFRERNLMGKGRWLASTSLIWKGEQPT